MRNPFSMTRDDLLCSLGLQTRRSAAAYILPAIGMFGVGIVTGAGLGLLFAPRTGREMRRELGTRMNDLGTKVSEAATKLKQKVRKESQEMTSGVTDQDSLYGSSDYPSSDDYSSGLGGSAGLDTGRRTGFTNSST